MVRLRVAVRIIPEEDFPKSIGISAASPVKGEKRLVVIVRDPYKWQIGTLALEVRRAYKSCYQHDLPNIKCLKDDDNARLDFESYVSDLLLDEGRAQVDASDQRVTVKVILEQGRALREGSVAVGSQLDDPRYQTQLEKSSRPPVPTFPSLPSLLGKRPFSLNDEETSNTIGTKRARQTEIPEAQSEEQELISSIEQDELLRSIELVKGTQYLNPEQENARQQSFLQPKDESPELRRLLQKVPPATADELEVLPEQPPNFVSSKTGRKVSANTQSSLESGKPNGILSSTTDSGQRLQKGSRGPITPPSESSRRQSSSANLQTRRAEDAAKSAAQLSSASASKFKRHDIYEYPESDIDDSQMSPRSRQAQLSHQTSNDRLSRIERLHSPQDEGAVHEGLSLSQAIDTLDDESVFEDDRPLDQFLQASELASRKASSGSVDATESSIYEDPETDDAEPSEQSDTTPSKESANKAASKFLQKDVDKENRPSNSAAARPDQNAAKAKSAETTAPATDSETPNNKQADSVQGDKASGRKRLKRGQRNRKSGNMSVDGDALSSVNGSDNISNYSDGVNAAQLTLKDIKPAKKAKDSRRTPSLDSPGEQLSQDLRESTKKQVSMKALDKKLANEHKKTASSTPSKNGKQPGAEEVSKEGSLKTPNGSASKQNVSIGPATKKVKKPTETAQASSPPSIVAQRAQEPEGTSNALGRTLRNWGSDTPAVTDKQESAAESKEDRLNLDKQQDPRKSPSIGLGLTAEEIKTMESRKNMTKEQYEAEKKRKQQEAKKKTEQQRKQEVAAKKTPITDKSSVDKTPKPNDPPQMKRNLLRRRRRITFARVFPERRA